MYPIHANILAILIYISSCSPSDIDSTVFKININNAPVKLTEVNGEHIEVFSKHGQQFTCSIPEISPLEQTSESHINNTANEILLELTSLNTTACLVHPIGWWTYKLCIGQKVSQYHKENDREVSMTVLGRYSSDFDWDNANPQDRQVAQRYHSQYYQNGDLCDVTSSPRTVEVQYLCHNGPSIALLDIIEPETCTYVLKVGVPNLCNIESLKPLVEAEASAINCFPALSDYDHSVYTETERTREFESRNAEEIIRLRQLQKTLPSLRSNAKRKVLMSGRTYRNRQKWNQFLTARRFIHKTRLFLHEVESNFEYAEIVSPIEIDLFSSPQLLSRTLNKHRSSKISSGRPITIVEKAIQTVTFSSKMHARDFAVRNRTLVIASALITHIRRNFEWQVENHVHPRLPNMLLGFVDVLRDLMQFRRSRHLNQIEKTLLKETILQPRIRPDLNLLPSDDEKHIDLRVGRSALDLLNVTALLSQKSVILAELKFSLKNMLRTGMEALPSMQDLSDDDENDLPIQLDLTDLEAFFTAATESHDVRSPPGNAAANDEDATANVENMSSTFSDLKRLLRSSQLRSFASKFPKNPRKKYSMKANLQEMGDGVYAVYVTIDDSNTNRKEHLKNEQNYAFKMN